MQDPKIAKNSPSWHHPTTLSGYIFATKAHIDNRKKIVKLQYLLHMSPNMVNFGPLAAGICWRVWGTPANFNWIHVLAPLLHGTLVLGVSQTAALSRGCHLYSAGWQSCWALAHILVNNVVYLPQRVSECFVWYKLTRFMLNKGRPSLPVDETDDCLEDKSVRGKIMTTTGLCCCVDELRALG